MESLLSQCLLMEQHSSEKGQINIWGSAGHLVSLELTQLCHYSLEAATDIYVNKWLCSDKTLFAKQAVGHSGPERYSSPTLVNSSLVHPYSCAVTHSVSYYRAFRRFPKFDFLDNVFRSHTQIPGTNARRPKECIPPMGTAQ